MTIGYSVEGSTDRALLKGLHQRWCPEADLIEGRFRGSTGQSLRREYRKICDEFEARGVEVMVFLTDADAGEWREVQKNARSKFPSGQLTRAIHGVADRNVECWICANPEWLAKLLDESNPEQFMCSDPKGVFERALRIDRDDRKEKEIAELTRLAPLGSWLKNASFEDFYEQVRSHSLQRRCHVENLRETRS
ncbi:MAG: hypothetical protein HYR60_20150 [Acidobacteria bacterium]|nr:hypothetical protein [Acidobacteriota bacterium]